jgi:hypothetical protein
MNKTKSEWHYRNAFLIQFRPETDIAGGHLQGRVEHVASYEATHFDSYDELLAFIGRLLTEVNGEDKEDFRP